MGFSVRDILKTGTAVSLDGRTLIPILRTRVWLLPQERRLTGHATAELSALVVCERRGNRVIDREAGQWTLEALCEAVPGLATMLDEFHV